MAWLTKRVSKFTLKILFAKLLIISGDNVMKHFFSSSLTAKQKIDSVLLSNSDILE